MFTRGALENRAQIPREELVKYRGQWVAFSADGRSIVASAATLQSLEERLEAAGVDAQRLMFEGIPGPEDDSFLGAEGLR